MGRLFKLVGFFTLAPIVLFLSIVGFEWRTFTLTNGFFAFSSYTQPKVVKTFTALPSLPAQFAISIGLVDSRIDRVRKFFDAYHAPLAPYADEFISQADKYGIPWQLLPAIAMQESQGGKKLVANSFNPFGWGINSKQTLKFDNFKQAIEIVSKSFGKNYIAKGLNTPEEIGKRYNPTDTNGWTAKVIYFMQAI